MEWYEIQNHSEIDSPAFVIFPDRIASNIEKAIAMRGDIGLLRPHVKTTKTPNVVKMMMERGIFKFKCATIAEAEMLGLLKARDVLLAYQPIGPKIERLRLLTMQYPDTHFSALVDNEYSAQSISSVFGMSHSVDPQGSDYDPRGSDAQKRVGIDLFIDLNVGQNRTGIKPEEAHALLEFCRTLPNIQIVGWHVYDGHIRDSDYNLRKKRCDEAYDTVQRLMNKTESELKIVAGGSPSFSVHCLREGVECSPGTFIYWDLGYSNILPEQHFEWAALVICRVISRLDERTICVDLGHKAIASENPFPRVHFLNLPEAKQIGHSEEHLVLDVGLSDVKVGEVLYGVPMHICPTCNLYESAHVVKNHKVVVKWPITARDRTISI